MIPSFTRHRKLLVFGDMALILAATQLSLWVRVRAVFPHFSCQHRRGSKKIASAVIKLPPGHPVARLCHESASRREKQTLEWGDPARD